MQHALAAARKALQADAAMTLAQAEKGVPAQRGLYAVHGPPSVWEALQLKPPGDDRPLYVGKSESSLRDREIRTHFGNGRTGGSTLRRSFAALLRESLSLHAQPRNLKKPERFANYALPIQEDELLTAWMRANLRLAVWLPNDPTIVLGVVERALLKEWLPPLNLKDCATPWQAQIKQARAQMAAQAGSWTDVP